MQITTLSLDLPLHPGDLPAFRACIADLVGPEQHLFHNHRPDREDTDRDWAYPRIQYAVRRGRAAIIGMDAGAEALSRYLLPKLDGSLHFAGREHPLTSWRLQRMEYDLQLLSEPQPFALRGWLALNAEAYGDWKAADASPEARRIILGRALTGHLRCLAETAGLPDFKAVEAQILQVDGQKRVHWHGVQLVRFDVVAQANLLPPPGIGIGRAAAFGFGEVYRETPSRKQRVAELRSADAM
jgi:hypothetical protein